MERALKPWTILLADSDLSDICLNGSEIWVDRGQGMLRTDESIAGPSETELKTWVLEELSRQGRTWDARFPFVDGALASGHRIHVVFPTQSNQKIQVSIRRLPRHRSSSEAALRWGQSGAWKLLTEAVRRGETVIISGSTGSGKTTLLNDLLSQIPAQQRIIALEDTPELAPDHPHFVSLLSRSANAEGAGEISLRTLLKQTLRMRPDRIILGECRGGEVLDLLQVLNSGHGGTLATLHANSTREAIKRLELLCLLHGPGSLPLGAVRELLALGVRWVAHVERSPNGTRQIKEVTRVEGREGETILMRPWNTDFD